MADNKKYKVGITVKEPWANNISYEQLDMTLFAVENGGDGCAYVALKPNIGVRPNQDATTWIKATQRGQSIYDYCIEYGLFVGTEEEFAQDYADAVQAAKDAAASATHVEEEVSAAEQGRVSAENARVSAESQRASAEESRVSSEAQRSVNETGRMNSEDSRVAAENARVVAENQRVSAESTRATNEENRRAEFGGMMRDAETAIGLIDTAMTEAENVDATVDGMIVTITDRHGVSKSVNIGFDIYRTYGSVAAMNADAANVEDGKFVMIATLDPTSTENAQLWVRNSNAATSQNPFTFLSDLDQASSAAWADWMENQKPIIEADHTTAVDDHTQAVSDHTNATNDHAVAGQDHTTAGTDHTQAVSDSTRAGQDHLVAEQDHTRAEGDHTTASTDHSTAQSDHTTAGTDHTTASSDHTIASGDHTTALSDHDIASGDHTTAGTDHTRAESDHTTASGDHTRAESDHTLAASDHTTASSDHGIASTDHTTAQGDHTQAGDDHTIASADHANATSDHTLAGNDHTRAESDHSTAAEDHTNAAADHTQAGEDHAQYLLDHESIASKANVAPNPTEGNVAALDENGNPIDSGIPSEKVAKTDGSYKTMAVGIADNLAGRSIVTGSFLEHPTGGVADVANGLGQIQEVQGNSVKFNQVSPDNVPFTLNRASERVLRDFPVYPIKAGNKILLRLVLSNVTQSQQGLNILGIKPQSATRQDVGSAAFLNIENGIAAAFFNDTNGNVVNLYFFIAGEADSATTCTVSNINVFDLTDIFGSGNEPSTVAEFEAWLAENVGLQEYYDYTDGKVINNCMEGIESIGFNLLDHATGKAEIIGVYSEVYDAYYGITGTYGTLTFEDRLGNTSTITPDSDGKFLLEVAGTLTVTNPSADCAIFLWWDGSKTEYQPYERNVAYIDVKHIYGKKNGEGSLVQVWPTGMPKVNDVIDKLCVENGAVVAKRPIAEVDMGTLNWQKSSSGDNNFFVAISARKAASSNYLTCKYDCVGVKASWSLVPDKSVASNSENKQILLKDTSYSDANTLKTSLSGVLLYYELETPETYTDLVYQGSSIFPDGTPVTLPVNYQEDNWGVERILPINGSTINTAMPTIICKYSIDAVETLDTHTTQIADLYDKNAELDAKKPNKQGDYPEMSVGSANALNGNTVSSGEYTFRKTGGSPVASGLAQIDGVKGKTLVWNQLVPEGNTAKSGTVNNYSHLVYSLNASQIIGHVYYVSCEVTTTASKFLLSIEGTLDLTFYPDSSTKRFSGIGTSTRLPSDHNYLKIFRVVNNSGSTANFSSVNAILIDLTQMFGAGNEPTTAAEFEALYPLNYYDYNEGQLINNCASAIDSIGFNQWDEEWELGNIDFNTGKPYDAGSNLIRTKNFNNILPSTLYRVNIPSYADGNNQGLYLFFYNENKEFIKVQLANTANGFMKTTPKDARYLKFKMSTSYGTTYNNDICINISDASKNGTYEPYEKHTCNLNLTSLTGKLNGEGNSVVVFPDGLKSAGSVFDEIKGNKAIKRIGSVDLGNYDWTLYNNLYFFATINEIKPSTSNVLKAQGPNFNSIPVDNGKHLQILRGDYATAAAFKTAMSGVLLYFELEEPLEYVLDEELPVGYLENGGGTEKRLPEDTASVVNAPLNIDMIYPIDVVKQLQEMPQNYLSVASLDALLSTLGTACNGTFSKTWDSTNGKYTFSFTSNVEPEPEPEQQGD